MDECVLLRVARQQEGNTALARPLFTRSLVTLTSHCYNPRMTLMEVTYELRAPLKDAQLETLGKFANTYGMRKFRLDPSRTILTFEYDASRLRETQVAHALGIAKISIARKLEPARA